MKDITDGNSTFQSASEELNKWVKNLKRVYDPVRLKDEVDNINSPLSVSTLVKFFRKRERALNHPPVDNM